MTSSDNFSHDFRAIPIGTIISDYQIESILGQGSFGITYLAMDMMLNRKVAIKEYFPREFAGRDGTLTVRAAGNREDRDNFVWGLQSFLKEARVLALFDHPNIVPVRRFFELNGTAYLVMDYCDGISLDELIKRDGLIPKEKLGLLIDPILNALELIHKSNFLHRDIKPANIFIKDNGTPVLLDFGAARQDLVSHSKSVTSLATPGYGAIEQYSTHGNQGPWTDIYGFGSTLYRVITGNKPDDATDRLLDDKLTPVSKIANGKYSEKTLKAIDSAMAVRPESRPIDIREWRKQFGEEIIGFQQPSTENKKLNNQEKTIDIRVKPEPSDEGVSEIHADLKDNGIFRNKNKTIAIALGIVILASFTGIFYFNKSENSQIVAKTEPVSPIAIPQSSSPPNTKTPQASTPNQVPSKGAQVPEQKKDDNKITSLPPCVGQPSKAWTDCYGSMVWPKKDGDQVAESYSGEFKNGLLEGKGKYTFGSGSTYTGDFKGGQRTGTGVFYAPSNFKYSGGWLKDKFHGFGTMEFLDPKAAGQKYVGQFADGMFNGKGTYTWPSGQKFVGNYLNDVRNGQGTLTYSDGRKYVGNFVNDLFDGQGAFYDSKGILVYQGLWENGSAKKSVASTAAPGSQNSSGNSALQQCTLYANNTKQELKLPLAVDNITNAVDIFCIPGGNKPTFVYRMEVNTSQQFDQSLLDSFQREKNKKLVCDTDVKMFLPIVDIEYQYYYGANSSNFKPRLLIGKLRYSENDCNKNPRSSSGADNAQQFSNKINKYDLLSDRNNLSYSQRVQKYRQDIGKAITRVDATASDSLFSLNLSLESVAAKIENTQTWGYYGSQSENIFIVFENLYTRNIRGIQIKTETSGCGKGGSVRYRNLYFSGEVRVQEVAGVIFRRPNDMPVGQYCLDIVGLMS
jgi:serine/threonine protein kinase